MPTKISEDANEFMCNGSYTDKLVTIQQITEKQKGKMINSSSCHRPTKLYDPCQEKNLKCPALKIKRCNSL